MLGLEGLGSKLKIVGYGFDVIYVGAVAGCYGGDSRYV